MSAFQNNTVLTEELPLQFNQIVRFKGGGKKKKKKKKKSFPFTS